MQPETGGVRRDLFVDERGAAMRVTWHPERDEVVVSLWRADRCTQTVRLSRRDAGRLAAFLATALAEPARDAAS